MSNPSPALVSEPRTGAPGLADAIAACLAILLGAAALYWVIDTSIGESIALFSIREALWFPAVVALLLVAAGTALVFKARKRADRTAADEPYSGKALLGAVGLVAYSSALFVLGFWLASTLAILGYAHLLGHSWRSPWLLATALVFPGLIQITFAFALLVRMPVLQVN